MENNFEIVMVEPSLLKPAEYNPRQMTEKQVVDLTASIKTFGLVDPIIVNSYVGRENIVVGGHQRLRIAMNLGMEKVPVHYVSLNEEQEKELNLRLNKNLGGWDFDILASNFETSMLQQVGFTEAELTANVADFGTKFGAAEGGKIPFQQMTFTLSDNQAEVIKGALNLAKESNAEVENFGNENSNGNALYLIVKEWAEK